MPPSSLFWLTLATGLLIAVLTGLDSDGLLLVGGLVALAMAPLTASLGLAPPLQLLFFTLAVALPYSLVQRWSRRQREGRIPPAAGADSAEVIAPFNPQGEGRVRWQGQSWAARSLEPGRPLPAGSRVIVMGREGTCLQVQPLATLQLDTPRS